MSIITKRIATYKYRPQAQRPLCLAPPRPRQAARVRKPVRPSQARAAAQAYCTPVISAASCAAVATVPRTKAAWKPACRCSPVLCIKPVMASAWVDVRGARHAASRQYAVSPAPAPARAHTRLPAQAQALVRGGVAPARGKVGRPAPAGAQPRSRGGRQSPADARRSTSSPTVRTSAHPTHGKAATHAHKGPERGETVLGRRTDIERE